MEIAIILVGGLALLGMGWMILGLKEIDEIFSIFYALNDSKSADDSKGTPLHILGFIILALTIALYFLAIIK